MYKRNLKPTPLPSPLFQTGKNMYGKFFLKNLIVFFLVSSSSQLKKKSESKGWI